MARPPSLSKTTAPASTPLTPTASSALFNACTAPPNFPALAWVWPPCSASFTATVAVSGRKVLWTTALLSFLPCRKATRRRAAVKHKQILLVEDNPDDEALTLRALKRGSVPSEVFVARDGLEAVNYLLDHCAGAAALERPLPHVVLLDLKLPKLDGLGVLRRRAGPPRRLFPRRQQLRPQARGL